MWTAANDDDDSVVNQMALASGTLFVAQDDSQLRAYTGSSWTALTGGRRQISSVWGTSPTDIWALAGSGVFENRTFHWDGTAWTEIAFPFSINSKYWANAIWGSAPNDYWIAGGHQVSADEIDNVFFHWDGSQWTLDGPYGAPFTSGHGFWSIWGSGSADIYSVGPMVTMHRDATGWSPVDTLGSSASDVFGTSATDVYLITGGGLLHWDGMTWSSKGNPAGSTTGWANSPTDIWLAGSQLRHYDGTFFVTIDANQPSGSKPFGTSSEMWTFDLFGATKWQGGFGGTPTTERVPIPPHSAWIAPDGHMWAASDGLIVH